jgi:hypothetical protein
VSDIARGTDPESSHAAGDHVTDSGMRAVQKHQTLTAVKHFPGYTSRELAAAIGGGPETRYILARRLADLEHDQRVRKGPQRVCLVSGHQAVTWFLVEAPAADEAA